MPTFKNTDSAMRDILSTGATINIRPCSQAMGEFIGSAVMEDGRIFSDYAKWSWCTEGPQVFILTQIHEAMTQCGVFADTREGELKLFDAYVGKYNCVGANAACLCGDQPTADEVRDSINKAWDRSDKMRAVHAKINGLVTSKKSGAHAKTGSSTAVTLKKRIETVLEKRHAPTTKLHRHLVIREIKQLEDHELDRELHREETPQWQRDAAAAEILRRSIKGEG